MDWSQVKSLNIPEGGVRELSVGDIILWKASEVQLEIDSYRYYRYIRKISNTSYTWVPADDSYSIAIPCKENTTYTITTTSVNPYDGAINTIFRIATTDRKIDKTISGSIPLNIVYYGTPQTQSEVTFTTGNGIQTIIVQMGSLVFSKIFENDDIKCIEKV